MICATIAKQADVDGLWSCRPSEPADLQKVWPSLAPRLKREFDLAESAFPWLNVWKNAATLIEQHCSRTFLKNGVPTVIMGWQAFDGGFYTTFIATDDYFKQQLSDIRYSRRAIERLQADLGNSTLISNSYGDHRDLESWFRVMGYEQRPSSTDYKVFVRRPAMMGA